jgi:hypothetical protein
MNWVGAPTMLGTVLSTRNNNGRIKLWVKCLKYVLAYIAIDSYWQLGWMSESLCVWVSDCHWLYLKNKWTNNKQTDKPQQRS